MIINQDKEFVDRHNNDAFHLSDYEISERTV